MATHSSVLAWRIPGLREPGGLPSMGSHRVGNDWSGLAAAAAAAAAAVLYCINTSAFVYPFTWLCMHVVLHCFSHVWLFVTPIDCSPLAPLSVEFARQEYLSELPFPSPMHESEKWKWSCSVVSDSWWPHGLQPTRLFRPWDFPGKSTGVGCHCLLHGREQECF